MGDLVGATRHVVDSLMADRTLAFRRLPDKHRAVSGSDDVRALAEERDRRQQGNGAIRCALREPADRTWVPIRGHDPTPFGRDLT